MGFAGQKAIITGASSGIGQAIAADLARQGAALWVLGRSRSRLEESLCAWAASALSISAVEADLATARGAAAGAEEVRRAHGGGDGLVECAGAISPGAIERGPGGELEE